MRTNRANRMFAIVLPLMLVAASSVVLGSTGIERAGIESLLPVTMVEASVNPEWLTMDRLSYLPTSNTQKYTPGFTIKRYHRGALLRADLMTYTVQTAYTVKQVADSSMEQGTSKIVKRGEPGILVKTVLETRIGLKLISREKLAAQNVKEPVEQVVHYGTRPPLKKLVTKSGTYYYRKSFMVLATAYEPSEVSCGDSADGLTAIGLKAGPGIVAVDPRVIPLRSKVYVEGYGYAIAGDVGGAIKGNRIDVCFYTVREALNYGRQRVRIYILEEAKK
jgi:3D (Asp-Asp-Asp) domain-containing protein